MSVVPTADRASARIPISNQRSKQPRPRRRERGSPYVPGHYDRLLEIKDHVASADLRAVTIALAANGGSVIVSEQSAKGAEPKHIIHEFPAYFDLQLADGRSVQIEIREFAPAADDDAMVMPGPELASGPDPSDPIAKFFQFIKL